ncbi:MAG TPA: DUF3352 domain-containing protein [Candidatus Limnocylindria bacterium]|nr:DUF3352 domain-containing protein [Candidatus Limnocylindria bacterium]
MLRRLVIALTTLLGLVGGLVIAAYLFVFAAGTDRAAAAVPAGATAYVTAYLQPSTGQQLNLATMLGNVPGFEDAAGLNEKLHQISARFLGQVGIDYEVDVRPWLGNQLSVAALPGEAPTAPRLLLLAGVKDRALAEAALPRLAASRGLVPQADTYAGTPISVAPEASWALLDELLLVASDRPTLEAALDADANRRSSLSDDAGFNAAMRRLPADHLVAGYVNLAAARDGAGISDGFGGYSSLGVALLAEPEGLRLEGSAPFAADAADEDARRAFALAGQVSGLAEWMPPDAQLGAVLYDLGGLLDTAEAGAELVPGGADLFRTIGQLRLLAAIGLGVSFDDDVGPLLNGESGIAVSDLANGAPHGQLILRPADPAAGLAALQRLRDALASHGATVTEQPASTVSVVGAQIPQVGEVHWAAVPDQGVVVLGFTYDDVAAALAAASDRSLADNPRYAEAWQLAGDRGGNELFVDIGALAEGSPDSLGMTGDARDILLSISALGVTLPARDDMSQLRAALTVR